jgi:transposase-like protein
MAKRRKKRTSYSPAQKRTILAAAQKEGLTANQVQKRFGVTPVTYYSWRKKSGAVSTRGRRGPGRPVGRPIQGVLGGELRAVVQARVREMLPDVVRTEVNSYLTALFGSGAGRRGRRKV